MSILRLLLLLLLIASPVQAATFDYRDFSSLPVQHEGRLKPVDSFARAFLTMFSGHDQVDGLNADQWLAEMLFDPDRAYERPVFNVPSPAVQDAIGLPRAQEHRYSFTAISAAMANHKELIDQLIPRQGDSTLDPAQQQVLDLYTNMLWYFEISRSVSLVLPLFTVHDQAVADKMGVKRGLPFTYLEMMRYRPAYMKLVMPVINKKTKKNADELLGIGLLLQHMEVDQGSKVLRVIPPQWGQDRDAWLSPWNMLQAGQGSPKTEKLLQDWRRLGDAYRAGNANSWAEAARTLRGDTLDSAHADTRRLDAEVFYNKAGLPLISLALYIVSLIAFLAYAARPWRGFYHASFMTLCGGALVHLAGLALRVYIMARPPVATLYESILFVSLIVVAGSLLLECRTRRGLGLAVGAFTGCILQFIGTRYAADNNSMGMLAAVLNTNFWLATHVVCVTIGYGCSLLAGMLGHLWLLQKIIRSGDRDLLGTTARAMLAATLIALLFATLGTILGGIWADQSWGRFWGWDPKENGALLIVLWLAWLLHGRLSGLLCPEVLALCSALTTIIVAVAWFGVNLLNVGLHSYGFTKHIAFNLGLFILAELAFVGVCGAMFRWRRVEA